MRQNHQNGVQKPSQKKVPKKHRKNINFQHPHNSVDRALAAARARFPLFDEMYLWHPFGSRFGSVLGGHMEAKAIKRPLQKNVKKMMPKMSPTWSQRGYQIGTKIVKKDVLEVSCFKGGAQVASGPPPGSTLERFWQRFRNIFRNVSQHLSQIVEPFLNRY